MKVIKGVVYFILLLILALLLAAIFAPSTIVVEREVTIEAPKETVYNQVADFKNWKKWDPWFAKDTLQNRNYVGNYGQPGYGFTWKSDNNEVGSGSMKVSTLKKNESMDYIFSTKEGKPANGNFTLYETNGSTDVKWTLMSEKGYPLKLINYFVERMVAPDFERGLSNLKLYVEENKDNLDINRTEIVTEHSVNYVVLRKNNVSFADMDNFFRQSFEKLYMHVQTNGLSPRGPATVLTYSWSKESGTSDLAAGIPISSIPRPNMVKIDLGVGDIRKSDNTISCTLLGGYKQNFRVHNTLWQWISSQNKKPQMPVLEQYIRGPLESTDTASYITKIIYHYQ